MHAMGAQLYSNQSSQSRSHHMLPVITRLVLFRMRLINEAVSSDQLVLCHVVNISCLCGSQCKHCMSSGTAAEKDSLAVLTAAGAQEQARRCA